jgi:hypothetical protein
MLIRIGLHGPNANVASGTGIRERDQVLELVMI